jgi:hypothetical protein
MGDNPSPERAGGWSTNANDPVIPGPWKPCLPDENCVFPMMENTELRHRPMQMNGGGDDGLGPFGGVGEIGGGGDFPGLHF